MTRCDGGRPLTSRGRLNITGHPVPGMGYGEFFLGTKPALKGLGVEDYGHLLESQDKAPVALWLSTPPHVKGYWDGQLQTIFTMWESSEIPAGFRENLHHMHRVFVPSHQNVALYSQFHDDVRYVPLAVDSERWKYVPRTPPEQEFRFLTAGTGPRKNIELVDKAFRHVFGGLVDNPPKGMPRPRLIVRAKNGINGKGITAINQQLSTQDEVDLYASSHCYVSGSRGEGWGFMPHQAIHQGLPTILPAAHGHLAFSDCGLEIDAHLEHCGYATFWGDSGDWWEPDYDQMCAGMWEVYQNYQDYAGDAVIQAAVIRERFSWEQTAQVLIDNLPEMYGPELYQAAEWVNTEPKLYRIVTNQLKVYTVNGISNRFEPGVEYWKPYDLKVMIGRAGGLDPSCIDPLEMGEEEANLALAASQESVCPTCGRPVEVVLG
jgi:hypothetical protein